MSATDDAFDKVTGSGFETRNSEYTGCRGTVVDPDEPGVRLSADSSRSTARTGSLGPSWSGDLEPIRAARVAAAVAREPARLTAPTPRLDCSPRSPRRPPLLDPADLDPRPQPRGLGAQRLARALLEPVVEDPRSGSPSKGGIRLSIRRSIQTRWGPKADSTGPIQRPGSASCEASAKPGPRRDAMRAGVAPRSVWPPRKGSPSSTAASGAIDSRSSLARSASASRSARCAALVAREIDVGQVEHRRLTPALAVLLVEVRRSPPRRRAPHGPAHARPPGCDR